MLKFISNKTPQVVHLQLLITISSQYQIFTTTPISHNKKSCKFLYTLNTLIIHNRQIFHYKILLKFITNKTPQVVHLMQYSHSKCHTSTPSCVDKPPKHLSISKCSKLPQSYTSINSKILMVPLNTLLTPLKYSSTLPPFGQ